MRKIIHIDMDCFFAAIECRDDPGVADKPVAVSSDHPRSVLTTCNYVAREFGCRSAMPVFMARQKCPDLIIKPIRFEVYRQESLRIRTIFREYTDKLEPLSLDEAFLDVSHCRRFAWDLAKEIRRKIFDTTGLTASAGVGPNKMLAKIASDWRKPNGQFAILPEEVEVFMRDLPVRRIPGVGPKAEKRLQDKNVFLCGDLQKWSLVELQAFFGPAWAGELYERCRGRDDSPVEPHRPRKSLSVERTFETNLAELGPCRKALQSVLRELGEDLKKHEDSRPIRSLFVKLKFANFQTTTREVRNDKLSGKVFFHLLEDAFGRSPHAVRLIGAGVRFAEPREESPPEDHQLELGL